VESIPIHALLTGTLLQIVGAAVFTIFSSRTNLGAAQYGFQVIFAFGLGINNAITATAVPLVVDRKDIGTSPLLENTPRDAKFLLKRNL